MCLASGNHGNQSDGEDFVQPFEGTKDPAFIFVEPPDLEKHINLKLAKMLVDSYPSPKKYHILPVANPKDVIQVSLQMTLYNIVDLDEKEQTITTNCEVITRWHDVFLAWNPEEYGNVTHSRLPWDSVWSPDVILHNPAGDGEQGKELRTLIQIDYQGNVTLLTQSMYMSKCKIDVTYYPFDTQRCELTFASWTDAVSRINLTIGNQVDKEEMRNGYSPSGIFKLEDFWAERSERNDACCEEPFADITYYIQIRRIPTFFIWNYIAPSVLINILALLTFVMPAETGEKVTLAISTMLSLTVFLMSVDGGIPRTEEIPIISYYFFSLLVLTMLSTFNAVLVLRIHHRGEVGVVVPTYLRVVAMWMADMTRFNYYMTWTIKKTLPDNGPKLVGLLTKLPGTNQPAIVDQAVLAIVEDFGLDESRIVKEEWKSVARIIDRCMLYLFIILSFINAIGWLYFVNVYKLMPESNVMDGRNEILNLK